MNRFFALLLITFALVGCNNKPQTVEVPAEPSAAPTLDIPLPTAEMLAALGPENDISIQYLLPNPVFVAVGKPKQFLASPIGVGNELLVSTIIMQWLQLDRFNPNSIERFVQASGFPVSVMINVPNPQDPNALPQQRILPIARRATVITFDVPIDPSVFFPSVLNLDLAVLETLKRTEGANEYYDLTPPDIVIPQRLAVGLLDNRSIIFVEGVDADIKAVFSNAIPKNALLDRLKRTPVENDLTILTSLEGLDMSPQMLEDLLGQIGNSGVIPQSLASAMSQHLRALSLSLNVSVAEGQPLVSISVEGRDEKGAEVLGDSIRGLIVHGQTTMVTMNDDAKKTLPIPPDFAVALLNAASVEVNGMKVSVILKNFETLLPTITGEIRNRQAVLQQQQLLQRRVEQMQILAQLCAAYYAKNNKFPADILNAEGKPMLSWRVALLPLLGLEELYNKFKLDEPWDSETNKELLNTMPNVFHPLVSDVALPKTVVRFFDSAGTPFANRDLKAEDLKSPQTTLLFVVVTPPYAVEWTKPDSLEFDLSKIAEVVGNPLFGVTFTGQICQVPQLPETDPRYENWKKDVEALVKGLPLQSPEQQSQQ